MTQCSYMISSCFVMVLSGGSANIHPPIFQESLSSISHWKRPQINFYFHKSYLNLNLKLGRRKKIKNSKKNSKHFRKYFSKSNTKRFKFFFTNLLVMFWNVPKKNIQLDQSSLNFFNSLYNGHPEVMAERSVPFSGKQGGDEWVLKYGRTNNIYVCLNIYLWKE